LTLYPKILEKKLNQTADAQLPEAYLQLVEVIVKENPYLKISQKVKI